MRKSVVVVLVAVMLLTVTMLGCGAQRKTSPEAIVDEVVRITQKDSWTGLVKYLDAESRAQLEDMAKAEERAVKELEKQLRELERKTGQRGPKIGTGDEVTHRLKFTYFSSAMNPGITLRAEVQKQGLMGDMHVACLKVHYMPGERDIKAGIKPFSTYGAIVLVKEGGKWVISQRGTTLSGRDGDLPITNEFCGRPGR